MLAPGGALTVLLGYLKAWKYIDAPLNITLYASRSSLIDPVRECRDDIEIGRSQRFLLESFRLGPILTKSNADCVLSTNTLVGRCDVPQLLHLQNLQNFDTPSLMGNSLKYGISYGVRDYFVRRAVKQSQCNVYISKHLKSAAEAIYPESRAHNHVIYNGLDDDLVDNARSLTRCSQGTPTLAAIQSPWDYKDTETLFATLVKLLSLQPGVDWQLKIAGGGNWEKYHEMAKQLAIEKRVKWLGHLDSGKIHELLKESLCLVFPSKLEGFGIPILEALACKCPVVASNSTAIPEVAGDAAVLVEPGKPTQFAEAVLRIYGDKQFQDSLIEKGLQRIESFRWSNSAKKMLYLVESLVGQRAS